MKPRRVRFSWLDVVLLSALAGAVILLTGRVASNLEYRWDWAVMAQYLVRYDQESRSWRANVLLDGLFTTIRLSLWATILATIIGTVLGLCRISRGLFNRLLGRTYVEGVRNLPPLVLIFIFYYFISDQIMPLLGLDDLVRAASPDTREVLAFFLAPAAHFSSFLSGVLALAIYEGAYITEIVRGGIQSVEKGQWEAGHALGLTWGQQMRYVILPQAIQRTIPPLAGQFISTIKDSAIVAVISIQELTYQGLQLMAATYLTFEIWITVAGLYLLLTLGCSLAARRLELRLLSRH